MQARATIAIALAAAAAAGCDRADDRSPPAASGAQFVSCESPAGFTLAQPRGWYTNAGDVAARCSRLDPDPIELRDDTDERRAAIVARIENVAFGRAAAPRDDERSRAMTTIDGLRAVRVELETNRPGPWPNGTPVTRYLVDLSPGDGAAGTLILDTVGLEGFDYERNQGVLDDVARRLEVTRDGVRTAPRVVARYGGKGAFRVVDTLRDGRACVRIPPDGSRRCVETPSAGGVALTKLRPTLAGIAGPDVFRVTAVRRGRGRFSVLPAPIGSGPARGFAFPFGRQGVRRLRLFADDGTVLGTVEPRAPARPRRTAPRKGAGSATAREAARLTGVRISRHATFDRVALDFAAGTGVPAYRVAYAELPLHQAGSGQVVRMAGNRLLRVRLRHVARSRLLGDDGTVWSPNPAIAQVADLGTFEGRRTIGIAFRAPRGTRPPFRVTALDHRLVVDIARRR